MKYVFSKNHPTFIRNVVFFIFGTFIGFFFCIYLHGSQIDNLIEKNDKLNLEIKHYGDELDTLKKKKNKEQKIN